MVQIINGVDVTTCDNESLLEELLDQLDLNQIEERKCVRSRLQAVKQAARLARDTRMEKALNSREETIKKRQAEAAEHKQRTLEMYDAMAKSAPAGGQKVMNLSLLRGSSSSVDSDLSDTLSGCSSLSGSTIVPKDLVEQGIRDRLRAADEEKKRILAAYDAAAKSGPAGTYRVADLKNFTKQDAANFTPSKPKPSCTFGSSGGIPIVSKSPIVATRTPASAASSGSSSPTPPAIVMGLGDANERFIRERQQEMRENKARILATYDEAAKSGAGPKTVIIPELPRTGPTKSSTASTPVSPTVCFLGGVSSTVKTLNANPLNVNANAAPADSIASTYDGQVSQIYDSLVPSAASNSPCPHCGSAICSPFGTPCPSPTIRSQPSSPGPGAGGMLRSPSDTKDMLLRWASFRTRAYNNVEITNFSSSWANGLAFCALIHSYFPDSFDYSTLTAKDRRRNFNTAFTVAEQRADIAPLLDTEDMLLMKDKPDWKCVFTYVQSMYRILRQIELKEQLSQ